MFDSEHSMLDALDIDYLTFPNGGELLDEARKIQEDFWEYRRKANSRLSILVQLLEEREQSTRGE